METTSDEPVRLDNDGKMQKAVYYLTQKAASNSSPDEIAEFIREKTETKFPKFYELYNNHYRGRSYGPFPIPEEQCCRYSIEVGNSYATGLEEFIVEASSNSEVRRKLYYHLNNAPTDDRLMKAWEVKGYPIGLSFEDFEKFIKGRTFWIINEPILKSAIKEFTEKYKSFGSFGHFLDMHFQCSFRENSKDCPCGTFTHEKDWGTISAVRHGTEYQSVEIMAILSLVVDLYLLRTPYEVIKTISKELAYIHLYKMINRVTNPKYCPWNAHKLINPE